MTGSVFTDTTLDGSHFADGRVDAMALGALREAVTSSDQIQDVRLWGDRGEIVYQSQPLSEEEEPSFSEGVVAAQRREIVARVTTEGEESDAHESPSAASGAKLIEVYVPTRSAAPSGRPYVLELHMSYAPVAETIAAADRRIRIIVIAAGLGYILLLLPQLMRISRLVERVPGRDPKTERRVLEALAAGQIVPHYQPVIDLTDGSVAKVEALARWHHPDRGVLSPASFLPGIEGGHVIDRLTYDILDRAFADAARVAGHALSVSVNVPPRVIFAPDFPERVRSGLDAAGFPGDRLTLEVTEDLITEEYERAQSRVAELGALGVTVSIDDFGTGHASLTRLAKLGAGELKIDRSFITGIAVSSPDQLVTRMVSELGETLGMEVIAEGVEHPDDARELIAMGCRYVQGFFFARPMDVLALSEWLAEWEGGRRDELLAAVGVRPLAGHVT